MRSGDEGDGCSVSWGIQEAHHILFSLVLTDRNNCPNLPPKRGTDWNGILGTAGCHITKSEHSGERGL